MRERFGEEGEGGRRWLKAREGRADRGSLPSSLPLHHNSRPCSLFLNLVASTSLLLSRMLPSRPRQTEQHASSSSFHHARTQPTPRVSPPASISSAAALKNATSLGNLLEGLTETDFDISSSATFSPQPPSASKSKKPLSSTTASNLVSSQRAQAALPQPPQLVDEYSHLFDDFPFNDDWEADLLFPPVVSSHLPFLE